MYNGINELIDDLMDHMMYCSRALELFDELVYTKLAEQPGQSFVSTEDSLFSQ